MATKLKLLFQGQHSAFILKGFVFAALLGFAGIGGIQIIPFLLFLGVVTVMYLTPLLHSAEYGFSFIILGSVALVTIIHGEGSGLWFVTAVIAGFLFYILLGIKNVFFLHRERWHYLFQLLLFYGLFILFFGTNQANLFLLKATMMFVASFLLWRDFFKMNAGASKDVVKQASLISGVLSLVMLESLWIISLLPLRLLNAANLGILITFIMGDIILKNIRGKLSRKALLSDITIFVLFSLLIFATSHWSI